MGVVYEAQHTRLPRRAAVKILHGHLAQHPLLVQRFFNEARAVGIVGHPGLVEVYDCGHLEDGTPYFIMEYLDGLPLYLVLQRAGGVLLLRDTLELGRQLAAALRATHGKRIVHRDLKPANIMVVSDPGRPGRAQVKLLDFGVAKLAAEYQEAVPRTESGALMGTPAYMAPEQCRGAEQVTDRADVYSLGIIIYQLVSGRLPFQGVGQSAMMWMQMQAEPRPLQEAAPEVPAVLVQLVHQMIAKAPEERPDMREVETRLGALLREVHPEWTLYRDPSTTKFELSPRTLSGLLKGEVTPPVPQRRPRGPALVAMAVVVLLSVSGFGFWTLRRPAPETRAAPLADAGEPAPPSEPAPPPVWRYIPPLPFAPPSPRVTKKTVSKTPPQPAKESTREPGRYEENRKIPLVF